MSDFELQRLKRIQENRAKLQELQLTELARDLASDGKPVGSDDGDDAPKKKQRKEKRENQEPTAPMRSSRRMQGVAAELPAGISMGGCPADKIDLDDKENGRGRTRIRFPELPANSTVVAPFTLRSIRTTVWDVGSLHRGAFAHRYWSSKGCLYHHAYPIGYRASKTQFGRAYTMEICLGDVGPVFKVTDDANGDQYAGDSPTKPWTDVCIAKKAGTRISGPQFFGFSEAISIRSIAALCTPEELDACRRGETVASAAPSAEELAVIEFSRVEGIGERTAIALARTAALPGAPLRTLGDLQALAKADGGAALLAFLSDSAEIPEATRRWPPWKKRLVPAIVAALQSDDPTASSRPPPKERKPKGARGNGPAADTGEEAGVSAEGAAAAAKVEEGERPAGASAPSAAGDDGGAAEAGPPDAAAPAAAGDAAKKKGKAAKPAKPAAAAEAAPAAECGKPPGKGKKRAASEPEAGGEAAKQPRAAGKGKKRAAAETAAEGAAEGGASSSPAAKRKKQSKPAPPQPPQPEAAAPPPQAAAAVAESPQRGGRSEEGTDVLASTSPAAEAPDGAAAAPPPAPGSAGTKGAKPAAAAPKAAKGAGAGAKGAVGAAKKGAAGASSAGAAAGGKQVKTLLSFFSKVPQVAGTAAAGASLGQVQRSSE